jgi:Dimerisation domain/O-methyltransferase domain
VSASRQPPESAAVRAQLLEFMAGFLRTQAVATAAKLGVADLVGDEPVAVQELAARVDADPSALHRIMRLLASVGIFSEAEPGRFVRTALSGRVLLVELVLPEGDEPSYGKLLDIIMLTLVGGKERTEGEWRALLREGGFELVGVTGGPGTNLIEAAPA